VQRNEFIWTLVTIQAENNRRSSRGASPAEPKAVVTSVPSSPDSRGEGVPCGGDLPPCYVVDRESHGTWDAYNPTGCGGTGCFGPYQFGGFWAGKLGLPNDLRTTTHEQWVNAARALWNNGAGCSNWDAC
jgi:hypothetical protein